MTPCSINEFEILAEVIPQIVWATDANGEANYFNRKWSAYTGLTCEESYGNNWIQPFHPDDRPKAWEAWHKAVATTDRYEIECRLQKYDGTYEWWLIAGAPAINEKGEVFRWFGTCTNIHQLKEQESSLKHAKEQIEESEKILKYQNEEYQSINEELRQINEELLESKQVIEDEKNKYLVALKDLNKSQALAKIGTWKWYIREEKVEWSDEMFEIFGIDKDTFEGKLGSIMDHCIHPEDRDRVNELNQLIINRGEKYPIEYRIILPNNTIKHILAEVAETLRDSNNEIYFSSGIVQDITERKKTELEILQINEKLREQTEVLELAHVLIRDLDDTIVYWNKGMEQLYGWKKEEALGKYTHNFFNTQFPESFEAYRNILFEQGHWEGELTHQNKSGLSITVASHHTLYRDSKGNPYLILEVNNDITDLKRIEKELRESEHNLKSINEEYAALNEEYATIHEEYLTTNEELREVNEKLSKSKKEIENTLEKVRLTNADLQKAQQVAKVGSWKWFFKEDKLEWSDEMFSIFGLDKSSFTGKLAEVMVSCIHPDDKKNVEEANQIVMEKGNPVPQEYRLLLPDNIIKTVWAEAGELIRDEKGKPFLLTGIVQDITERKQMLEKLTASEERYRLLVENYPRGSVNVFNRDLELTFVSGSDLKKFNWKPGELVGKKFREFVPEQTYTIAEPVLLAALEGVSGYYETSWDDAFSQVHVTPVRKQNGLIDEILVVALDVSEQKKLEREKHEKDLLYRTLIEKGKDVVVLVDIEGRAKYFSPSVTGVLGFEQDELIGVPYTDILHPDDLPQFLTTFEKFINGAEERIHIRTRHKHKNGEYRWIEAYVTNLLKDQVVGSIVVNFHDITERKEAEEKLLFSESKLKLFVEYAPAAIAMFDNQMRYIAVSNRFLDDYKIDKHSNIVGRCHYDIFPELGEERKQIHQRCLSGASEKMEDDLLIRLDGSMDWIKWEIHPWYEKKDKIGGILFFSEVITTRKNAEIALLNSEERYRSLVENFPDGTITVYDRDLRLKFVAGSDLKKYNTPPEEFLGKTFRELTPDEAYQKGLSVFQEAFQGKIGHYETSYWQNRYYQVSVSPLRSAGGNIEEILVISQNVTERKQAEEKARERESQFKTLFENAPEPMFIQLNSKFAYVNQAAIALYKAGSASDLIGTAVVDRIHPDYRDQVLNRIVGLNQEKIPAPNIIYKHLRINGEAIDVEVTAVPVRFDNQDGALVFVKDITERKRAEEKLKESEIRFSTIFNSSPVGASLIELSTQAIVDANEAYLQLIGYKRSDIINHTTWELGLYADIRQRDKIYDQLVKTQKFRNKEVDIRKSNGEIITLLLSCEIIYLSGEAYILSMMLDITDRKKTEKALKASEEKFRSLFETIQLGIVLQDKDANILLMNRAAEQILGVSSTELQKNYWSTGTEKALKEDGNPYTNEELPAYIALKEGKPTTNHIMQVSHQKTGEKIWINNSAIPLKQQGQEEQLVYLVFEDISERVKYDHESRKLRTAFAQSSSSFVITDRNGIIEDINQQTEIVSGYSRDEILSKTPSLFKSEMHNQEFYQSLWESISSGNTWEGQIRNKHKDGHLYWINTIISPIKDSEGKITHYFATCNDITQQKEDREELNRYRQHLEKLVEERTTEARTMSLKLLNLIYSMPLGYIETDLKGNITAFNKSAEVIFGYKSKNMIGNALFSTFNFTTENVELLFEKTNHVKVFTQDHLIRNKLMSCRWNVVSLNYTKNHLIGFAYIIEDITLMKQAEQSLQFALDKEKELNELKSGFVSMTSHQFRTPLTTILSNAEMLEDLIGCLKDDEVLKGKRFLKRIYDNIERLNLLMSDVLLVGKNQAGRVNFRPQTIQLIQFIKNLTSDTKFPYQNDRIANIEAKGTEIEVVADPQLLAHILQNLLSNAFKYSKKDVGIVVDFLKHSVKITIADNGIGIPEEEQPKLFNSFYRASNTENLIGTGLGLVIVKEYIEMHGGTISFRSKLAEGSEFTIELPYQRKDKNIRNK